MGAREAFFGSASRIRGTRGSAIVVRPEPALDLRGELALPDIAVGGVGLIGQYQGLGRRVSGAGQRAGEQEARLGDVGRGGVVRLAQRSSAFGEGDRDRRTPSS